MKLCVGWIWGSLVFVGLGPIFSHYRNFNGVYPLVTPFWIAGFCVICGARLVRMLVHLMCTVKYVVRWGVNSLAKDDS